ncbi:MAG: YciI family protein [Myxococcales bacterium]
MVKLITPRPSFMADMDAEERAAMMAHVGYWTELLRRGHAVAFGPVADPAGPYGLGVLCARDEGELAALLAKDPAILAERGLRHEVAPMLQAMVRE